MVGVIKGTGRSSGCRFDSTDKERRKKEERLLAIAVTHRCPSCSGAALSARGFGVDRSNGRRPDRAGRLQRGRGILMLSRVIARAIAFVRIKAQVKQWLSPSLYAFNLSSKSNFRRSGLIIQIRGQPAFHRRKIHLLPSSIVFDLIFIQLADAEIAGLWVAEIKAAN